MNIIIEKQLECVTVVKTIVLPCFFLSHFSRYVVMGLTGLTCVHYPQHSKLFYEPRSRTYYAYDEEKREYRLHSRENADHLRRHCEELFVRSGGQHAPPVRNLQLIFFS